MAVGSEAISTLYSYDVTLFTSQVGGLSEDDVDALMSAPCCVSYWSPKKAPADAAGRISGETSLYRIRGVISELELLPTTDTARVSYRARVVPSLWKSTLFDRTRVHEDKNLWETAKTILESDCDLSSAQYSPPTSDTGGRIRKQEFKLQYAESDFAFLSRHLEYWGAFYFFSDEASNEVLTFGSTNASFKQAPSGLLTYDPATSGIPSSDALSGFSRTTRIITAKVQLASYDPAKGFYQRAGRGGGPPTQLPQGAVDTHSRSPSLGLYHRGTDVLADNTEANELATLRAEEIASEQEVFRGTTNAYWIRPGVRFTVNNHPVVDLNGEYVITSIDHQLEPAADVRYEKRFSAIPFSVPYRPPRLTARPQIAGLIQAMIASATPGDFSSPAPAPIDDQGRYRVLLPAALNADSLPGPTPSLRVRMAQPSTGGDHGVHFPLHVGAEVLLGFIAADPDRPVIMGAVPNKDTVSPVTSSDSANTKGRIKSRNGILIEFEDVAN
jgi:type VI secretion system secreted protein VgrG